jgi:hypothetical protein
LENGTDERSLLRTYEAHPPINSLLARSPGPRPTHLRSGAMGSLARWRDRDEQGYWRVSDPFHDLPEGVKAAADLLSIAALVGSFVNILPAFAAILTIIWTAIRIYETDTVQRLLGKGEKR